MENHPLLGRNHLQFFVTALCAGEKEGENGRRWQSHSKAQQLFCVIQFARGGPGRCVSLNVSTCIPVEGTFCPKNRYFTVVELLLSLCMRNAFQTTNKASVLFLKN